MKLFELTQSYKQLQEIADELDEMTLIDTLESIEDAIEDKVVNTAKIIKTLEAEAIMIKEEENRLYNRRKSLENKANSLKSYLQGHLEQLEIFKVKTPTITVSIRNNPHSVNITNSEAIPQQFLKPQQPTIDKSAIKAAIEEGRIVEGAELIRTKGISIK